MMLYCITFFQFYGVRFQHNPIELDLNVFAAFYAGLPSYNSISSLHMAFTLCVFQDTKSSRFCNGYFFIIVIIAVVVVVCSSSASCEIHTDETALPFELQCHRYEQFSEYIGGTTRIHTHTTHIYV